MSELADLLAQRIAANGPMTLADYMAECLLHPSLGYYTTQAAIGAEGDFTTAPEISQMFGELLGLSLAQSWLDQGAPAPFVLAELGPGRGTLMADILRATRRVPGFHDAAQIAMVEASPRLRALQARALGDHPAAWFDHFGQVPPGPLFLVANEFFDALPIRQFQRSGGGWREVLVGLTAGKLTPGLGPVLELAALAHRLADTRDGDIVETCAPASAIAAEIGQRIASGGAALIVDYGGWQSLGDTFQALSRHEPTDPFAAPGRADLTAHVDFAALAQAASPAAARYLTQGAFLTALGIAQRSQRLMQGLTGDRREQHLAATRRLTDPTEMGTLFKVLALHPAGLPPPPGTDA